MPAGGDIPDPEANPKFAHKLQFLDELTAWFAAERATPARPMIAVGDLNIAPLETDVWSHKQLLTVVSHTPVEVERLGALQRAGGFVDAVRHFVPPERAALHLVELPQPRLGGERPRPPPRPHLGDAAAGRRAAAAQVHRDSRGWDKASDHVPVMIDIAADWTCGSDASSRHAAEPAIRSALRR